MAYWAWPILTGPCQESAIIFYAINRTSRIYLLAQFCDGGRSQDSVAMSCHSNDETGINIVKRNASFETGSLMDQQALAF